MRWLARCNEAHKRKDVQNLFPIVQGGLDAELRKVCIKGRSNFERHTAFDRLIEWVSACSVDWVRDVLIDWLIAYSVDWVPDVSIDWLIDWLLDSLVVILLDWLIDWFSLWFRDDQAGVDWICDRRTERRWAEGKFLEDGWRFRWPFATQQATLRHGSGLCGRLGRVLCPGRRHVWLRVSHAHRRMWDEGAKVFL